MGHCAAGWVLATTAALVTTCGASGQTVSSAFEFGAEGWTSANNGATAPVWVPPAGNDDGFLQLTDATTGWGYFRAPTVFVSQAARYGGTFSFDLRHEVVGDPVAYSVRVGIVGGGLNLINESVLPTGTWTNYSFSLDELTGWRVFSDLSQNYTTSAPLATQSQMQSALANIAGLYIAADYTPGYAPADLDRTSIDNVVLDVVPAPGATGMVALGVLFAARRRR